MTFELTNDWELVKAVVIHPAVYNAVSDDLSPERERWEPLLKDIAFYVLAWEDETLLGLWVLTPENGVCYDVHTCLLPVAYGEKALRAAKEAQEWLWANTPCLRLITHVPVCNRLALRFAVKSGMEPWGRNPNSYKKDGVLYDQILLGISKPGVK